MAEDFKGVNVRKRSNSEHEQRKKDVEGSCHRLTVVSTITACSYNELLRSTTIIARVVAV